MPRRVPIAMHQRHDISRMYTVQLVSPDSVYDDAETRSSNRAILLTCAEYIVMDLRDENDRARVPMDIAFHQLHTETFEQFDKELQELMLRGEDKTLERLLKIIPPNKYATEIRRYLTKEEAINDPKPNTRPKITIRPSGRAAGVQAKVLPRLDPALGQTQRIRIVSDNGAGGSDSDE